jgi:hypothetical protein
MGLNLKELSRLGKSLSRSGVLIGTSPFGGAHTRRGLAIGNALHRLLPDMPIHYASGGPDADIYRRAGVNIHDVLLFEA